MRDRRFYIYIMASRSRTLYIGFTSALQNRVQQHKDGDYEGFSKRYQCHRLIYFETYTEPQTAIAREKQLKRWSRSKKLTLILSTNPAWYDLSEEWGAVAPLYTAPPGLSTSAVPASGRDDTA